MTRRFHWLRTYVETAANRTPEQLFGIVRRKAENVVLPRVPLDIDSYYDRQIPDKIGCHREPFATNTSRLRTALNDQQRDKCRGAAQEAANGSVTFLSRTYNFDRGGGIQWHERALESEPLLWWLKIQGFEHFAWPILGYESGDHAPKVVHSGYEQWFQSWVNEHAIADEPGFLRRDWIPHSVSLRILNWSRYLAWAGENLDEETRELMTYCVAKNAAFLSDHIEYDLDGNHLVENAVALLSAGLLTGTDRWRERGTSVFERAARSQFLADGCHFERSPMYHIIVTTRFLTAIDLLQTIDHPVPSVVRSVTEDAVAFLEQLRPPDNRIPLFHDSVYGEALALPSLLHYAENVGIGGSVGRANALPDSGYYCLGETNNAMLCVGGPIAVPSIPAHAHVHLGHVSLYLDGLPILTDTGTYTYKSGNRRAAARSIRNHNTVQVGDFEPVAIAGSFLMGNPVVPRTAMIEKDVMATATAYETEFEHAYRHRRDVFHADDWWLVWDTVETDEPAPVCARYHCHPDIKIQPRSGPNDSRYQESVHLQHEQGTWCELIPLEVDHVDIDDGEYYPRFGVARERSIVRLLSHTGTNHAIGCLVHTGRDTIEVTTTGGRPTELNVGERKYDLPRPEIEG